MPSTDTVHGAPARSHHTPAGPCTSPAFPLAPPQATGDAQRLRLTEATRALWTATLALMTAFMQVPAPAHRYLLAQRISRNLVTLADQECFDVGCRERFARLARRWLDRSREYAPKRAVARVRLLDLLS